MSDESVVRHLEQKNEVADVLRRARALVDTPEKWCGGGVRYTPMLKCSATAIGIASAFNGERLDLCDMARGYFAGSIGAPNSISGIWVWNDAPERTHADVLQAFDRAIELAERGL